ncbi:MAG: hypothetical protein AB1726_06355 [Planctomycetota bacterium]
MRYEPRTIAFLCELLHPPLAPDPAPIQRIHNRMFQAGTPLYKSFAVTGQGSVLSNPAAQPGAVSTAAVLGDRLQFREELSGLTVDEFATRVREIATAVADLRHIPVFPAQIVTIRTLINPRNFRDSRAFLRDATFGFGEELQVFGRTPQLYGLRLVFPPQPDAPNAFTLRAESFAGDARSLFLENQGSFGPTLVAHGTAPIEENVRATYDFVVDRAFPFIARFDVRQEV